MSWGRYSVLTAVGLYPIAASGADILTHARCADARVAYSSDKLEENESLTKCSDACILKNRKGKVTEL